MKQLVWIAALTLGMGTAQAQDFKAPLTATWNAFDTTKAPEAKTQLANKLGLISKKWANEWSTHFYYSLAKTIISYNEKDEAKHDALLDEADKEHDEAVTLMGGKENDETYVLAAMIANSRMAVNPMQRWQKYGKIFTDDLNSAKEINEKNPRIYYMRGVSTLFTPKAFGGGRKAALPYFEKAGGYFATESNADITKPYWGKTQNTYFMEEAKKEDKE